MARKPTILQTNMSAGEVSDLFEDRPDVGKRYNAVRVMENFWPYPEGSAYRRPGTKYLCEVKNSNKPSLLESFEYSTDDSFVIEYFEGGFRFIKNRAQLMSGGSPYEVSGSPYTDADLLHMHFRQSADVLFSADGAHEIQKLTRLTDTNWSRASFNADPPPSFNSDDNLNVAGYPSANSGDIKWRTATDIFLLGDEDRRVVAGTGIGNITAIDTDRQLSVTTTDDFSAVFTASVPTLSSSGTTVTSAAHGRSAGQAIILTSGAQAGEIRIITAILTANTFTIDAAFSFNQSAGKTYNWTPGIAAGLWFLRGAPQATCDVQSKKEPIGALVNLNFSIASMRPSYVGKFIKLLGGTIELTEYVSAIQMKGVIRSVLTESTTANPGVVAIGAWRLHEGSWSATHGFPFALEFHQGRLLAAGTTSQPTTVWGSNLYDLNSFAVGALATDAYEFTIRAKSQDGIQSLTSLGSLFIATANDEHVARGTGSDAPIAGDTPPLIKTISHVGSQHVQPLAVDSAIIVLQRLKTQVNSMSYSVSESADADSFVPSDLTIFARQISEMKFAHHQPVYYQIPNAIVFFIMENGQLAGLTFKPRQEVAAWSRTVTDGEFESVAVVPHENSQGMTVYVVVKRVINGATKRFIEYFEDNETALSARGWTSLHTDCAVTGTILAGATTIAVPHLEGETVDVVIGGSAVAQKIVTGGVVTLAIEDVPEGDTTYEVGLHYNATVTTLRPSIPNEVTDCLKRMWKIVFVRLKDTIGGLINGKPLKAQTGIGGARMFSGLAKIENVETEDQYDGALTIVQNQPYPMTVVGISGQVAYADEPS